MVAHRDFIGVILIGIVLALAGCGDDAVCPSEGLQAQASYFGDCTEEALYCAGVIGNYTEEYEIVYAPMIGSEQWHAECRAKIGERWYWVRMTGWFYGVKLCGESYVPMEMNEATTYSLTEWTAWVVWWQDQARAKNDGGPG